MPMSSYSWICSYDIRHHKRLEKLHKLLCMQGISINYSVFYLVLNNQQYTDLCQKIKNIICDEDDVRLYRCAALHTANAIDDIDAKGVHILHS